MSKSYQISSQDVSQKDQSHTENFSANREEQIEEKVAKNGMGNPERRGLISRFSPSLAARPATPRPVEEERLPENETLQKEDKLKRLSLPDRLTTAPDLITVPMKAVVLKPRPAQGNDASSPSATLSPQDQRSQPPGGSGSPSGGMNNLDDDDDWDEKATIPMMVLKDIATRKGQAVPSMESEISGSAGNAAFVSAGNIMGTVLKYGITLVITRGFGPQIFGLYTLFTALIGLISQLSRLGLDDAVLRYVAIYRTKEQAGLFRGLIIFGSVAAGVAGALGALFVFFFTPLLLGYKHSTDPAQDQQLLTVLQWVAPIIPIMVIESVWTKGLAGFKDFRWRVLSQKFLSPVLLILLTTVVIFFFHSSGIIGIATAFMINAVVSLLMALWFFFGRFVKFAKAEKEKYDVREWLGFAVPNLFTNATDIILESIDTLLLAALVTTKEVALYAVSQKICGFIGMPLVSFNAMFSPTIAELHARGDRDRLEEMFKIITKWTITFSLPIFGVVVLFAPQLMGIFGERFVEGWPLVIAFALGNLVNIGTGSVGYMLMMTGHQKASFINSLLTVGINVVLGIFLVQQKGTPYGGVMGLAIATGAGLALVNILRLIQVRVLLKMQPYRWDTLKPIAALLISSLVTGGLLFLIARADFNVQVFNKTLPIQLGLVPVFLIIYVVVLYLFGTSPEDEVVLASLRKKLKRFGKKGKKKKKKKSA